MTVACPESPPSIASESRRREPPHCARRFVVDTSRSVVGYQGVPRASTLSPVGRAGPEAMRSGGEEGEAPIALVKPTFVRCTCEELATGELDWLDAGTTVLEVIQFAELGSDGSALDLAVLQATRGKGYKLAFDARLLDKAYAAFVPLASYLILDMGVMELDRAAAVARAVHSHAKAVTFATQVRTAAEFDFLARAGVKLYEGLWFTQPPATPDRSVQLGYASLVDLMNMVTREAEIGEIEDLLKRAPTLSFKLLRYLNSAGFGRHVEITSFRHAVLTVGMKRLLRWTALLIAGTPTASIAPAVGTLATVRGRMMELLAGESLSPEEADLAFVTGILSMLDSLLGMPLADALALVTVPKSVADAILRGEGPYARYLAIAKACETGDEAPLDILSSRYGISATHMMVTHLDALAWTEQW